MASKTKKKTLTTYGYQMLTWKYNQFLYLSHMTLNDYAILQQYSTYIEI